MKQIPLTRGLFAFVDDDKFEFLNQWKWCALKLKHGFYAYRARRKNERPGPRMIYMHRLLLGIDGTFQSDHWDGNGLNNTMANLRVVTASENRRAFQTKRKGTSSKYRGVFFDKTNRQWKAAYKMNGQRKHIGIFKTEHEAAQARDAAVKAAWGDIAYLNGV